MQIATHFAGGEIREWNLTTRNVRVPTWTAFVADIHDITAVLGEREVVFTFGHIQDESHNTYGCGERNTAGKKERKLNFAPHELNTTMLKRHSSGWGTDFTATDVSLQTMFEFGKGHCHSSNTQEEVRVTSLLTTLMKFLASTIRPPSRLATLIAEQEI